MKVDSGLYCCQKTKEQCTSHYSQITYTNHIQPDITCNGEPLNLTQQCNNRCNFYGFDEYRNNWGITRSYLDICKDNKYEFQSRLLSILITLNNK